MKAPYDRISGFCAVGADAHIRPHYEYKKRTKPKLGSCVRVTYFSV